MRLVAFSSAISTCSDWIGNVAMVTLAVMTSLPSRSPPTQLAEAEERGRPWRSAPGIRRAQGPVQRPVDLRHRKKEGLVENCHDSADLVERLDLRGAQLTRPPQRVDLLDQSSLGVDAFALRPCLVIEAVQLVTDPADRSHHSTPPRLCRVGCEDRVHLEIGKQLLQTPCAVP